MLLFLLWTVSYGLVYAGQLLFDGVPVDITTTANEDLVIAPGAGGNTQIGTGTGTNTHATSNDDLHLTGILEADGAAYLNSATTLGDSTSDTITLTGYLGSHAIPATDSTYDLGSSTLAWRYLYADIITGYNANLALNPASGYSLTGLVTKNAATGNEVAYDLAATINKATAGNYTGLKLNVTETSAPGAADLLLDLQVGGASMFSVDNVGNVTAAGGWNFTGTSSTDFKIGNTSDASTTNLSLTFGNTNPETITFTGATTDDFTFSDDIDMNANVIKNIGNAGTDFVAATGALNLAGDLTLAAGANVVMSSGAGTYAQTYTGAATPMTITADSMTAGNGISISADALTTGYGINVDSVSTAANSYRLINLSSSGANANATRTRYGIYSSMTGTGATSTNIAGYFSSTQAANNYGLIVENGYNGFGTTSPAAGLAVGAGTFSNPSANPGNDLYVTGNLEVDGTIYGPAAITGTTADTFTVNSDNTAAVTTTLQLGGGAGASGKIATTVGNLLIDTAGGTVDIDDGIIDLSSQTVDVTLNNAVDALNFDSNTLSIDASNNRVGIRALSPDAVLEIGDGGVGDRLRVLGDSGEPALLIDEGDNIVIGDKTGGYGGTYLEVDAITGKIVLIDGNVGIGTTSPAARLDVDGAAQVVTAVTQRAIINNTNAITTNAGATAVYGLTIDEPNITVGALTPTNASSLYISGAPTEATNNYALWVDSGNVQIDDNLTVSGTITGAGSTLTGTTADTFTVNSDNTAAVTTTLQLGGGAGASGKIATTVGNLLIDTAGGTVDIDDGIIDLSSQTVDVTLNNAVDALNFDSNTLSIDAASNYVGIGTAAPGAPLDVRGRIQVIDGGAGIRLGESSGSFLVLNVTGGGYTWVWATGIQNNTGTYGLSASGLTLPNNIFVKGRNAGNSAYVNLIGLGTSDQVSIASGGGATAFGGNVGIGDTSPDAELDVEGTAPTIYLTDSTASAKGLAIDVDANKADLREISGASGSLLCLDLANAVVGIGTATPSTTNALTLQRNGAILRLQDPNNGGHNYMEWYSNGAAQARTAYFGYGFDGSTDFTLVTTRGGSSDIVLDPENGVGIDLSGPLAKLAVFGGIAANYTDVAFPNLRGAINHYGNSGGLTIAAQGANNSTAGSGDITFQNPETNSVDASTDAALTTHMTIRYNGNVGIGTTDFDGTPAIGRLIAKGSTADGSTNALVLRDSGEANVFTVDTDGNVTAAGTITGSGTSLTGTTADTFTVNSDNSANAATLALGSAAGTTSGAITTGGGDLTVTPAGDDLLLDGGLTVGSTTQAGDNNLRVEGTSALVGNVTCTGDIAVNGGDITSTGTLTITPTTYFGIGTTPSVMLDVLGWDGSTWSAVGIRIANTSTDATQKQGRIKGRHYTNTEESLTGMIIDSQATASLINIGGGSGTENAATQINLYTASNNTTTIGTVGLGIDSSGNTTLAGDLAVNGGDITSTGDLTLDPAGNDVILDNANLTFTAGYDIRPATNTTTALNIAQADGTDFVIFDTSNKKVGIGGTPLTKLDISDSTTTTTNYITLTNTGAFAAGAPAIDFYNSAGSIHTAQLSSSPGSGYAVSSFVIAVADAAMALQTRLTIDVNGNVGIGPAAPTHKLDVSGAMYSRRYGLTDGATIAVDWNNGNTQSVTLAANRIFTFANGQDGGKYTLIIKQDGTGSRTVTWPAEVRWSGATAPTLTTTASKTDYFGFIYNGVDSKYDGVAQRLNF